MGRDPEIAFPRPVNLANAVLDFFFIPTASARTRQDSPPRLGQPQPVRARDRAGVRTEEASSGRRARMLRLVGTIGWCIAIRSVVPALFIVLPRSHGGAFAQLFNMMQHAGLARRCRSGSPSQHPYRPAEPGVLIPLCQYELPRRASHVSGGAVSRLAAAARVDQRPVPARLQGLRKPMGKSSRRCFGKRRMSSIDVRRPLPDRRRGENASGRLRSQADPH